MSAETHGPSARIMNARLRGPGPVASWPARVTGERAIVGDSRRSWNVGGSIPASFRDEERDMDEAHVFRVVTLHSPDPRFHHTREDGRYERHVSHVRVVIPHEAGGIRAADAFLAERGYLRPWYRRSHETPQETDRRRRRECATRLSLGLPVSYPNPAARGASAALADTPQVLL